MIKYFQAVFVVLLASLCTFAKASQPLPLFTPEERSILDLHTDLVVKSILKCQLEDHEKLMECARKNFSETFGVFEKAWIAAQNKTDAPSDVNEIREESSECFISCIMRGSDADHERCIKRCGRIMEGVAEVSKRKALLAVATEQLKKAQSDLLQRRAAEKEESKQKEISFKQKHEEFTQLQNSKKGRGRFRF
ncbi:uncharacterized protein MONOS_3421 [Monocercomonoides exilis]|uniref:uncharacterized protein n=1 Tax=Monocercomonoides exilis TaxID=2049356 RepID=UPI00355A5CAE|nr:hypothetical protein MONOS_3421 [Monocercomonoides exilis]